MGGSVLINGALSAVFVLLALLCVVRLWLAHPGSSLGARVHRSDDVAELLMCVGMLAMVSPVGGPIPLAGWLSVFTVSSAWLAVQWVRGGPARATAACQRAACGHHAACSAVMLYMFAAMQGHSVSHGDPWLTLFGHEGTAALPLLALAAACYFLVDITLCTTAALGITGSGKAVNGTQLPMVFGSHMRLAGRVSMSAAMGAMLLAMV